jgi:PAS domain S-box-containing protein
MTPEGITPKEIRKLALIAFFYFLAYEIAYLIPDANGVLAAVWPASGIGLAMLLLNPRRLWLPIVLVLFLAGNSADFLAGRPLLASIGFMTANVLESLASAWFIAKVCDDNIRFTRVREVLALIGAATLINSATSFIGASTASIVSGASFWEFYRTWWITDGLGILLVTPVILSWAQSETRIATVRWIRMLEGIVLSGLTVFLIWAFNTLDPHATHLAPPSYLLIVPLGFLGVRFGPRTVSSVLLLVVGIELGLANAGLGLSSLGDHNPKEHLLAAQLFLSVTCIAVQLLSASFLERKQSEETLRQSETNLKTAEHIADIGHWIWDALNDMTTWSEGLCHIVGWDPRVPVPPSAELDKFYTAESWQRLSEAVQKAIAHKVSYELELEVIRTDGEHRWTNTRGELVLDASNNVVRLVGTVHDITEHKRVEEALANKSRLNEILINQIGCTALLMRPYTREIIATNKNGVEAGAAIGNTCYASWAKRDRPCPWCLAPKTWKEGTSQHLEVENDGIVWDAYWVPIDSEIFMHYAFDITERKRVEEALRENEQRLSSIYDTVGDVIFHLKIESEGKYRFISVNKAFCNVTGLSQEQVVGKMVSEIIPVPSLTMVLEKYKQAENEKKIIRWEETSDYPTGRLIGAVSIAPVVDDKGYCTHLVGTVHDITERKRLEQKLLQISAAVESSSNAIGISDAQGRHIYQNKTCTQLFEYASADEMQAAGGGAVVVYDPAVAKEMFQSIQGGGSWSGELKMITKSGRVFDAYERADAIKDDKGNIIGLVGIITDITERKREEEVLKGSEEKYRIVSDFTYDWEHWYGPDGRYIYVSPSCERITGYRVDEFMTDPDLVEKITHPDDRARVAEHWHAAIIERGVSSIEFRIITRSGDTKWITHLCQQVFSKEGTLLGTRGSNRDTTERKHWEEMLQDSERQLRRAQSIGQLGHWSWNRVTTKVTWSDEMYRIFDVNKDSFDGDFDNIFNSTVHPDDRATVIARTNQVIDQGQQADPLEFRIVCQDGTLRYIYAIAGDREFDEQGKIKRLSGVVQDITTRKQIELELENSRNELRKLSQKIEEARENERFWITHKIYENFGQNLAAIKMMLSLLGRKHSGDLQTKAKIDSICEIVDSTVDELRSATFDLRPTLLDEIGLIEAVEAKLDKFTAQTGISHTFAKPKNPVITFTIIATAVFRIIEEALTNVEQHARATNVDIAIELDNTLLNFSVTDNGRGFSIDAPIRHDGVGIIHMKERAKTFGGTVEVLSEPNKGTSVRASMPIGML